MRFAFILLALAIASLPLLAGCASEKKPEANETLAVVHGYNTGGSQISQQPSGEPEPEAQPESPEAQSKVTCALELGDDSIPAGSSVAVRYSVYSPENTGFEFLCGEDIEGISAGGLVTGMKACKFTKPGNVTVWVRANKKICAQKTLEVRVAPPSKLCYIEDGSVTRDLNSYVYGATVRFLGFSTGEKLQWVCDSTVTTLALKYDKGTGMPLYEDIYCDFPSRPKKDYIEVKVGSYPCGNISTR